MFGIRDCRHCVEAVTIGLAIIISCVPVFAQDDTRMTRKQRNVSPSCWKLSIRISRNRLEKKTSHS